LVSQGTYLTFAAKSHAISCDIPEESAIGAFNGQFYGIHNSNQVPDMFYLISFHIWCCSESFVFIKLCAANVIILYLRTAENIFAFPGFVLIDVVVVNHSQVVGNLITLALLYFGKVRDRTRGLSFVSLFHE
jgi:hypothetical protein